MYGTSDLYDAYTMTSVLGNYCVIYEVVRSESPTPAVGLRGDLRTGDSAVRSDEDDSAVYSDSDERRCSRLLWPLVSVSSPTVYIGSQE